MKKLLFSLVAAGACGGVIAAPAATADFTSYTVEAAFDVTKQDDGVTEVSASNPGYWTIDTSDQPEMTIKANGDDKYLQINTGSTPLWRTFAEVRNATTATSGKFPDNDEDNKADGDPADGVVVSSKVKLTACTEFPKLTDFPNEKLALFLFCPEEGDTTPEGLYAIGGEMTEGGLKAKAYKLDIDVNGLNVTNAQGWATVSIKTYGDIYKGDNSTTYPAFVIGINGSVVGVDDDYYVTGFENAENLIPAATTRITGKTLIPAALPGDGTICGLGFQGEGGIDKVNLAANESEVNGMADAVAFTVAGNGADKATFGNNLEPDLNDVITVPASVTSVSFTLNLAANEEATVTYKSGETAVGNLTSNGNTYTFAPVANATLTITVKTLFFQANGTGYATFTEALTAALAEGADGTVTLLGNVDAPAAGFEIEVGKTVVIDLCGKKVTATRDCAFYNLGNLTITDSTQDKNGEVIAVNAEADAIQNAGGTLLIEAGKFTGKIRTNEGDDGDFSGTATVTGGSFSDETVASLTAPTGKKWELDTYGYYTLVNAGPVTSTTVDLSGAGTGADVEVPLEIPTSVTEVTVEKLPQDFAGKVVIPSTVEKIIGVAKEQLKVMVSVTGDDSVIKTYNITEAIKLAADGTISLDDTKTVTVEVTVDDKTVSEDISVKPELATTAADGTTEVAPFEAGATPAATVKTIPGLTYSLDYDSDVKGAFGTTAASKTADGNRMTLQDTSDKTGVTKRFYKIRVSK